MNPDQDWRERVAALNIAGDEQARVIAWRLTELQAAGYDLENALALAGRLDVDLRQAVTLLHQGCTLKSAVRILL